MVDDVATAGAKGDDIAADADNHGIAVATA